MTIMAVLIAEQTLKIHELNPNHKKLIESAPFKKQLHRMNVKKSYFVVNAKEKFME